MSKAKDIKKYTDANQIAWDASANQHRDATFEDLKSAFHSPDFLYLGELEKEIFSQLDLKGKSLIQLACNNGRETISVGRLGAARAVGFDISAEFIDQGHELIDIAAAKNVELYASDVYEIPSKFNGQFDIAFVSVGALMLMPDLNVFFAKAAELLKGRGQIFLYERHPLVDIFAWQDEQDPPQIQKSYFDQEPIKHTEVCNYWTKETYACDPMYTFHHTLGDVFSGLINCGFKISHYEEYQHDVSEMYVSFEKKQFKLPLCYTLIADL